MKIKTYERLIDNETKALFNEVLELEEYSDLKQFNVRFAIVTVTIVDEEIGQAFPVFKTLPYKVKINNIKDRLLKQFDVEILIDGTYWSRVDEEKQKALFAGALYSIEVVYKKDFVAYDEDGVIKMKLLKPDMIFVGYSGIAEKYGYDSPEMMVWQDFINVFDSILYPNIAKQPS